MPHLEPDPLKGILSDDQINDNLWMAILAQNQKIH